ncbi:hypothetical protein F5146DRAFT_998031 [Armillaria mellea]|nr:hypothetical protein F5146DRAFT_998031 [Armillaria mellea]
MSDLYPYYSPALLSRTFGTVHIGATLAAILFGVTNLQAVIYYRKYRNDWWVYKCTSFKDLRPIDRALDALHVALSMQSLYIILINYGSFVTAFYSTWWYSLQQEFPGHLLLLLPVKPTDNFDAISYKWPSVPAMEIWASFSQICPVVYRAGISARIDLFRYGPWNFYDTGSFVMERSTFAFFATLALSDFVIAIWMCYYLYQSKAAARFSNMASMLLGLMRLILVSGLATSSSLARLNRRQEHLANKSPTQHEGHLNPPVVRITQTTENSVEETNINIPLREVQRVHSSDELDHAKGGLSCEV